MEYFFNKKIIYKTLFLLGFLVALFMIPQKTFAACGITSGSWRNFDYGINFEPNWFNASILQNSTSLPNNVVRPYIYLDLTFNNDCVMGSTFNGVIREKDTLGYDAIINATDVSVLSFNFTLTKLQNTFVFRAGDKGCEQLDFLASFDCFYFAEITTDNGTSVSFTNLQSEEPKYKCYQSCGDQQWQYIGIVNSDNTPGYVYQLYKAENDPDFQSNQNLIAENNGNVTAENEAGIIAENNLPPAPIATISCDNGTGVGCIENPLGDGSTLPAFVQSLLGIVIRAAIPLVVLALVYTGFRFVEARGNPDKISKAKQLLLWTVVGSAVVLGAWTIATILTNTVNLIIS